MKCRAKGCSKEIYPSELIKCITCKNAFHIQCQNITTAYYLANSAIIKKSWKCSSCTNNMTQRQKSIALKNKLLSQSPCASNIKTAETTKKCEKTKIQLKESHADLRRNSEENIIVSCDHEGLKGPHEQSISKFTDDFSEENSTEDLFTSPGQLLSRSVNEVNCDNRLVIEDLQAEIIDLTSKLLSTQQELDNQLLENGRQNEIIKKLTREVNLLTSICQTPVSRTMSAKKTFKRHSLHQMSNFSSTPRKNITETSIHTNEYELKMKTLNLEKELEKASLLISQLEKQIRSLKNEAWKEANVLNTTKKTIAKKNLIKHKLHLVSTDRSDKVLGLIAENFASTWNYCRYSFPNRSINNIMDMIPNIIKDLSPNDYCVILIGEEDFHVTGDYLQVVYKIRNTLKKYNNTNFIVCLPTYICGKPLYNSRVEMFNKLLMLDIESHEYAFWIDLNAELTFNMFSFSSGRINYKGFMEVFNAIKLFVREIDLKISTNNINQPLECCMLDDLQGNQELDNQSTNTNNHSHANVLDSPNHSFRT